MSGGRYAYTVCDLTFLAGIPFPELRPGTGESPEFRFRLVRRLPNVGEGVETGRTLLPDGRLWMKRVRAGGRHLLDFDGLATFLLDTANREILACRKDGTPLAIVRHLFLNQVLPLYLGLLGKLIMHASAVAARGRAVAFMGDTCRGKSTLARSLMERGCELITDDMLLLDRTGGGLAAVPSYPGLRLWPDSLEALGPGGLFPIKGGNMLKQRLGVGASNTPTEPVPIDRVYLLSEPADHISIRPVPARQALTALLRCNFHLEIDREECLARQFRDLSQLAVLPIYYSLRYPHDFRMLPRVCEAVLEHASESIPA